MKFYIIMTDCTDIERCSLITEISKKNKFTELNHISGGSTTFSCFEFFNGCNPSNIIKDGVGYLSFGDSDALTNHAPKEARIKYSESNKYEEDWKFLEKEDLSLFHILNKHNIKSIIHNSGWAGRFIKSKKESLYYSNEDLKEFENIILDYPDFLSQDELNLWGGFRFKKEYVSSRKYFDNFYKYEKNYIQQLQKSKEDLLFFVDDNIYHDIGYNNTSLECLTTFFNSWDFNEPDSVFLVLTDHYGTRSRLFNSELWSVWGMIKDNRSQNDKNGQSINTPLFSSCDIYNTVLDFFNIKNESKYPLTSRSMFMPLDKERIYFKEDSRLFVTCFGTDTLNAFKVIKWNNNNPIELLQLIYLKGKTPTDEVDDDIEGIYQVKVMSNYDNTYKKWRKTTIYPCNLLNLSDSYLDSQIKLLANSLKEHFKIKDLFTNKLLHRIVTNKKEFWLLTQFYKRKLTMSSNDIKINMNNIIILKNDVINLLPDYKSSKSNSKYKKSYIIPKEESICIFNIYNTINHNKNFHIIGDSHTAVFNALNSIQPKYPDLNKMDSIPYIKTYRINAGTAYNSKVRAIPIINSILETIDNNDYLVFCYGEVDCRAHLIKQFNIQKDRNKIEIIKECVDKIIETILYFKNKNLNVIAYGPPPTFRDDKQHRVPINRWFGNHYERNHTTKIFNDFYQEKCKSNNIKMFTLFYDYTNEKLETQDNIHLKDGMHLSSNVLKKAINYLFSLTENDIVNNKPKREVILNTVRYSSKEQGKKNIKDIRLLKMLKSRQRI